MNENRAAGKRKAARKKAKNVALDNRAPTRDASAKAKKPAAKRSSERTGATGKKTKPLREKASRTPKKKAVSRSKARVPRVATRAKSAKSVVVTKTTETAKKKATEVAKSRGKKMKETASAKKNDARAPKARATEEAPSPGKERPAKVVRVEPKVEPKRAAPVAEAPRPQRVVRIAKGDRKKSDAASSVTELSGASDIRRKRVSSERTAADALRAVSASGEARRRGPIIELNPRLESGRGKIASVPTAGQKPMSVAAKHRAAAEAAFTRIAPTFAAAPTDATVGAAVREEQRKADFEHRVSERDSLTTSLRIAHNRDDALHAARELADRFRLPPDQTLLMKVICLDDPMLTKLALEELLELDDRGRVRPNSDLLTAVSTLHSDDAETLELKSLFLEKLRA